MSNKACKIDRFATLFPGPKLKSQSLHRGAELWRAPPSASSSFAPYAPPESKQNVYNSSNGSSTT